MKEFALISIGVFNGEKINKTFLINMDDRSFNGSFKIFLFDYQLKSLEPIFSKFYNATMVKQDLSDDEIKQVIKDSKNPKFTQKTPPNKPIYFL